MSVAEDILAAIPERQPGVTAWATVTSTAPLQVKFPGDDAGTAVARGAHYTPALNDVVGLVRFGVRWTIVVRITT